MREISGRRMEERGQAGREYAGREICRPAKVKAERRTGISALDVLLFLVAGLLLAGILMMVFDVDLKELPTSVNVIWWSLVSFVGAWVVSLGM